MPHFRFSVDGADLSDPTGLPPCDLRLPAPLPTKPTAETTGATTTLAMPDLSRHNLYELDSARNEYRKVEGYKRPFSKYEMPVPAAVPEHGVIMWIDKKVLLYKHKVCTGKPLKGPAVSPKAKKKQE